jgi:hypothetical protein
MNPDHIETWRNYLAGKLHERYGVAMHEAQRLTTEWMESLEPGHALQRCNASEFKDPEASLELRS